MCFQLKTIESKTFCAKTKYCYFLKGWEPEEISSDLNSLSDDPYSLNSYDSMECQFYQLSGNRFKSVKIKN